MKKPLSLRQIEAFKALIETGAAQRAADALFISQPAVSKLLSKLEEDTGLVLFERVRGRLVPTRQGMLLYDEIDRIFVGLHQIEHAVDSIRRDEQKQLRIGAMPALSGSFVRRITMEFLKDHPDVKISVHTRSSQFLADWLATRQIDVALVSSVVENPLIDRAPILPSPLFCALPLGHSLATQKVIRAADLDNVPFVSFQDGSMVDKLVKQVFAAAGARLNSVLSTVTAYTVCDFVAAGLGVSLIHPFFSEWAAGRIALRPFEPVITSNFQLGRSRTARNASLVNHFLDVAHRVGREVSSELPHR